MKAALVDNVSSHLSLSAEIPKYPDKVLINREVSEMQIINAAFTAWENNCRNPINTNDIYEVFGFCRKGREWDIRTEYISYQRIISTILKAGFAKYEGRRRKYFPAGLSRKSEVKA